MKRKINLYLTLMRPANILTAIADILAGYAISSNVTENLFIFNTDPVNLINVSLLILATACLYSAGMVFNDVFDINRDAIERPERILPQGLVSKREAILLGTFLNIAGIILAFIVNVYSGGIACVIAASALAYNAFGKNTMIAPFNMGLCRALNLLLGISGFPEGMHDNLLVLLIPFFYVSAITFISRNEVKGGRGIPYKAGFYLYLFTCAGAFSYFIWEDLDIYSSLPFLVLFVLFTSFPILDIQRNPSPLMIQKAVKFGVLGIIILNSSIAAGFSGLPYAVFVFLLLPVSLILSHTFAVT
ncbi:MAG: UbiA-like protein EboC [Cytophagaceae bacterium]